MEVFFSAIDTIVVLVFLLLEKTLVTVSVVGSTWRSVHVVLVTLSSTFALGDLLLSVLV